MAQEIDRSPKAWWDRLRRFWRARGEGARHESHGNAQADEAQLSEELKREAARAQRHGHDGALVLLELDPWARLQHQFGAECVAALDERLAQLARQQLRGGDWLLPLPRGVWAVYLPCTDPLGALDAADRLRHRVATLDYRWAGQPLPLSASLGLAHWQDWKREPQQGADQLLQQARQALAMARGAGCNCVRAYAVTPSGRSRYSGTRPA
ncbi:diguanylate cyclase (GGDEF) domain-containing protein [Roseateles sp. YR242]|uniref:GGDEF domain-containing protein n=1 Tax=Roseateles sp. YR242 TaxID=1855305 RepID=UPI0008C3C26F|nr:diguanylate cyclase [Roseateles sp. YR242]SEK27314.1 diguanylate cyclase (GGDEF) domain-containing protein [Roseateles sp. YR242]